MRCTRIYEPQDPLSWRNAYLCAPRDSGYFFKWSYEGRPIDACHYCIQVSYLAGIKYWRNNYLCAFSGIIKVGKLERFMKT